MRISARILTFLLAFTVMAGGAIIGSTTAHAARDEATWPFLAFDDNGDGTATITGCVSTCNSNYPLEIPATVEASGVVYDVTAIADEAFEYEYLEDVTLPEGLESIGAHAFDGNDLTDITLPSTLTSVGTHAFRSSSLGHLEIPAGLTDMEDRAFYYAGITGITWLGAPTSITAGAFSSNELTSLVIPPSVTTIADNAFSSNWLLTTVTLPPQLESIGAGAFGDASSLMTVTYPGATSEAPHFPATLTSIGDYAFNYASLSGILELPVALTHLGESAFADNSLAGVVLPETLAAIGADAFSWNQIMSVIIPASVTTVESWAFNQNPLVSVAFVGDEPTMGQDSLGNYEFSQTQPPLVIYDMAHEGFGYPTWTAGGTDFPTQPGTFVDFITDHGISPDPQWVSYDGSLAEPEAPDADGHNFLGWFTQPQGGEEWDFDTDTVTSGLTLYAQWEATTHAVTFVFGAHAADAVVDVEHGDAVTAPDAPFLPGHRFAGWTVAGEPADFEAGITAAITFTARYDASEYALSAPAEAEPGDAITVTGSGFDPHEGVAFELHSEPVALGTTTADATGTFSATVTLPESAVPGNHEVIALGAAGQAAAPITLIALPPEPEDDEAPSPEPAPTPSEKPTDEPPAEPTTEEDAAEDTSDEADPEALPATGPAGVTGPLAAASALLVAGVALLSLRRRVR